ncbi:SURF1 family protein [Massilia sp. PWRC2]|uniref:SURF1 family protein n=1 Tax=Massilia sp. PWRC2 TaxID=2804626 RepID=UPI003CF2DDC6
MMHPAGAVSAPRSTVRSPMVRWLAATFAIIVCLGFCALGTWQFLRLQWKLDLIERVGQRVHAPAVAAPPPSAWAQVSKAADEYRHVSVQGHYLVGADALVQANTDYGSGFWLMTPFCTTEGAIVLVNQGFVAPSRPRPLRAPVPASPCLPGATPVTTVVGLLRLPEVGGGYLRHNDPAGERWYSRDVAAIASARQLPPVAPYFIDREASPAELAEIADAVRVAQMTESGTRATDHPVGGLTVLAFNNNHLVYALTWFALALMSAGGIWLLLRRPRPQPQPERQDHP